MGSSFPQANDKPFLVAPLGLLPLPASFLFFLHRLQRSSHLYKFQADDLDSDVRVFLAMCWSSIAPLNSVL